MSPDFAVRCIECEFVWRSAAMAEGLRLIGSCPRCNGALEYAGDADKPQADQAPDVSAGDPHMVLGVPRR